MAEYLSKVTQLAIKLKRKPRLLIAKLGQDGHDRGANIIATSLSDAGFEVHQAALFQTPQQVANHAMQLNVDIVGISSLAGAHSALLPALIHALNALNAPNSQAKKIQLVAGGVIPQTHIEELKTEGVAAIFSPGDKITNIINTLINLYS